MKKNISIKHKAIVLASLLMMTATACGTSSSDVANKSVDRAVEAGESSGLYEYGNYASDDYVAEESYDEESSAPAQSEPITEEDAASNTSKRKLITNISMSVETKEFDSLLTFLRTKTNELGGYIESENIYNNSDYNRTASLTIRIPEAKLDGFTTELSEKSNVRSQDKNVTDVTLSYADLEGHKKALVAEQNQLLALMERAETMEDILQIQSQLTEVSYQIESMESQLRTFDNQVTYSTLRISIDEVVEYAPAVEASFAEKAKEGFVSNCLAVVAFFESVLLAIITHIPTLIVLIVVVLVILAIVKICAGSAKKRKAKRMQNSGMIVNGQMPMQNGYYPQNNIQNAPASTQEPAANAPVNIKEPSMNSQEDNKDNSTN